MTDIEAMSQFVNPPFRSQWVLVTPEWAAVVWAKPRHKGQRRITRVKVDRYKKDMLEGRWRETHQGIGLDKDGSYSDGGHRLQAVVESGVSIKMMVSFNVPDEAFWAMDCGARRTLGHFLSDEKYPGPRAAFLNAVMAIQENNGIFGQGDLQTHRVIVDNPEILEFSEQNPHVLEYAAEYVTRAFTLGDKFPASTRAALLLGGFVVWLKDPNLAEKWFLDAKRCVDGDGLPDGNPVKALWRTRPVTKPSSATEIAYMRSLRAAIAYRDGEKLDQVRLSQSLRVWDKQAFSSAA